MREDGQEEGKTHFSHSLSLPRALAISLSIRERGRECALDGASPQREREEKHKSGEFGLPKLFLTAHRSPRRAAGSRFSLLTSPVGRMEAPIPLGPKWKPFGAVS